MQKEDSKEESSMKMQQDEKPNFKMQQPVFFSSKLMNLVSQERLRNKMKQDRVRQVTWLLCMMALLYTFLFCRIVTPDGQPIDPLHAKLLKCVQSIVIFVVYLLR